MNLAQWLAILFALSTAAVIAFQLALAAGVPWGAYTMGGAFPGRLPAAMRAAAITQAAILIGLIAIVLASADLLSWELTATLPWLAWVPVAFSALSVVLNAATRSSVERRIWLPVALLMLGSSLGVALA